MSYNLIFDHKLPAILRQIRSIKKFRQPKFYAVAVGRRVGIYRSWPSSKVQIQNISNAKYKIFDTHKEALEYLETTPKETPITSEDVKIASDTKSKRNKYQTVYIDGSCWRNGSPNACAGLGIYWPGSPEKNQSLTIDGKQTSIRAEIWAAIMAIRQARSLGYHYLYIYSDSHFVIQCATVWIEKWKRSNWITTAGHEVKNRYDMMALDEAVKSIQKIIWRPVVAHSGVFGNEEADRLAKAAIAETLSKRSTSSESQSFDPLINDGLEKCDEIDKTQ
ncbi:Ribonuclease H1 [Sarcoptes scabiei]|uniref:ribonuclease H n=1 Tax=Sarcoptes scabiei TaxID=52283 RepID=A0A131ZVL9_SARSC|nr:Ribonuclease H1 [Sarcoptes scabiei]KPM02707.1 ribonuclease H1-like protein [Sarcoptes scabiei]